MGVMNVFTVLKGFWSNPVYICQNISKCTLQICVISTSNTMLILALQWTISYLFPSKCHLLLFSHFWLLTCILISLKRQDQPEQNFSQVHTLPDPSHPVFTVPAFFSRTGQGNPQGLCTSCLLYRMVLCPGSPHPPHFFSEAYLKLQLLRHSCPVFFSFIFINLLYLSG